jgi:predicted MFS family arabinose efflux permease
MFGLSCSNMMAEGSITDVVPVIYLAVRHACHWSATATARIFSVTGLTGAITAPLAGRLLDRLDPRYVFLVGGLLMATGFVTSSFASEPWHLMILYGVVLTMGETIVSGFAIHAILVPWFPRARGRVIGLVKAGNQVGTLLFVPLAQLLVSTLGWQETFRVLGLVFRLLLGPANFFFLRPSHFIGEVY